MNKFLSLVPLLLASCECTPCATETEVADAGYENPFGEDFMAKDEFQNAWDAFSTPGEEHAELLVMVGEYDVTGTMLLPDGEEAPLEWKATIDSILGDRYISQQVSGEMMEQPFEGVMLMGFNNLKQEYFSVWFDNMTTGYYPMTGGKNAAGELELHGTIHDVMTPDGRPWHIVIRLESKDRWYFEMYDTSTDGSALRVMESTYSRTN